MLKARKTELAEELVKLQERQGKCDNCKRGLCLSCNRNIAHVTADLNVVTQDWLAEKQARNAQSAQAQAQAPALAQAQARAHTEAQARAKQQAWSRARARERAESKAKEEALEKGLSLLLVTSKHIYPRISL